MPDNYAAAKALAEKLNYRTFTDLQENAFCNGDLYDESKNIFVTGETSAGKTLIPMLLFYMKVKQAKENGEPTPKLLLSVPYRALAAQKTLEITNFFKDFGLKIVQSTGEFRQNDDDVQSGDVDIAVVITEKIYKYASRNPDFLSKYDYLVLDEIGLIGDSERGVRLDFIIAWAYSSNIVCGKPRIMALGTPSFDWSSYINDYGFVSVTSEKRPINLLENTIVYSKGTIASVEKENDIIFPCSVRKRKTLEKKVSLTSECVHCKNEDNLCKYKEPCRSNQNLLCPHTNKKCIDPVTEGQTIEIITDATSICEHCPTPDQSCILKEPCRLDLTLDCPHTGKKCIHPVVVLPEGCSSSYMYVLYSLCKAHLERGHQILIFVNNREEVKRLCRILYTLLKDELPKCEDPEKVRNDILSRCELDAEDVYGVFEDATLEEHEKYIYYEALSSGIGFHSASVPNEARAYVEENLLEKKNLKIVCSTETLAFGINSNVDVVIVADLLKHDSNEIRPLSANEYKNYIGRAGRNSTKRASEDRIGYVYTLIRATTFDADGNISNANEPEIWENLKNSSKNPKAMHSLLFKNDDLSMSFFLLNLFPADSKPLSKDVMVNLVSLLPKPEGYKSTSVANEVTKSIKFLKQRGLIDKATLMGRISSKEEAYCLTDLGERMRGYIIGKSDYELIFNTLTEQIKGVYTDIDRISLINALLSSKHAASGLGGLFANSEREYSSRETYEKLLENYTDLTPPRWLSEYNLKAHGASKNIYILAAIIAWMDSDSPKTIFKNYGIHYSLLAKLAEQLGYLLEIAENMMPWVLNEFIQKNRRNYGSEADEIEELNNAIQYKSLQMKLLFFSLYYGINIDIWQKFISFLKDRNTSESLYLAEKLSYQKINPYTARILRKMAVRYKFFETAEPDTFENIESKNNYFNQKHQYISDIGEFGNLYKEFFASQFKDIFN